MPIADYQCEHLFLLIGKNPLPNYVAAKLLIKSGAKVYFVYSETTCDSSGTEDYKKRLVEKLKAQLQLGSGFFTPIDVPLVNPSDANCIKAAIKNQFANIPANSSIGLNYTGGTKAMSVHAYRAIEEFGTRKNCRLKFSYLDPRELQLRFDGESRGLALGKPAKEKELFAASTIKLLDLLDLHGLEPLARMSQNPRSDVRFAKIVEALFEERFASSDWQKVSSKVGVFLSTGEKKRLGYNPPDKANQDKYAAHLRKQKIPVPNGMPKFHKALDEYGLLAGREIVLANLSASDSVEDFCKFLRSDWFEDFVLSKVKQAAVSSHVKDCASSLEIALHGDKDKPFFEIDIVALRGYQLFALACTTDDDIKMCKSKLFEIAHRAKQLGGDETRIGLVCRADAGTVITLQQQLREDHIKVFGIEDLATLEDGLEEWFNGE